MSSETPDHCATLGIKRGASNEELNAAYRRLALMHHPDKNRGNEEVATAKFQEVCGLLLTTYHDTFAIACIGAVPCLCFLLVVLESGSSVAIQSLGDKFIRKYV